MHYQITLLSSRPRAIHCYVFTQIPVGIGITIQLLFHRPISLRTADDSIPLYRNNAGIYGSTTNNSLQLPCLYWQTFQPFAAMQCLALSSCVFLTVVCRIAIVVMSLLTMDKFAEDATFGLCQLH